MEQQVLNQTGNHIMQQFLLSWQIAAGAYCSLSASPQ
jgi:hypothetical protein